MAYQRTEYADKTMSMNSLADRKLRIKLGSIESHKGTIEKEMKREKKKLERELGGLDRLTVTELPESSRTLSPRFSRRYSTPPELLSASLPPPADPRRSPLAVRRRLASDGIIDPLSTDSPCSSNPSLLSPTSMFLKAPFDQPRRQSLPPIGDGGLLNAENTARRERRGSYGGGLKNSGLAGSPNMSGSTTPRGLSRKGTSLNEAQMNEITAKVSKFLQKMDHKEQGENKTKKEEKKEEIEPVEHEQQEFDRCQQEGSLQLMKNHQSKQGLFQPLNFE